ncbi:MAG: hypothetical protein R3F39_00900 [Myxococcota bacterium]
MTVRPTARRDLRIEERQHPAGAAWVVRVPADATRYWFGRDEIEVLRALDGHSSVDLLAARLGANAEGGEAAIRALIAGFGSAGLLEAADTPLEAQVASSQAARSQEGTFWGQLRAVPLSQVVHLLVDLPAAATDCGACELTCCAYSVSVGEVEADRIVAAVADDGRWRRGFFDGSERTGTKRLFRISRQEQADGGLGGCVFLQEDSRCQVQRRGGLSAKPVVCRLFPMRPMLTPDGPRTSLRPGCPHATPDTSAEAVATFAALLAEAADLRGELIVPCAPSVVELCAGVSVPWGEYAEIERAGCQGVATADDVAAGLRELGAAIASRAPEAAQPLDPDHLERLTGTLAPMLGQLHGEAFARALGAVGGGPGGPIPSTCPKPAVIHALEGSYPLQFATALAGIGVIRLLVAAVDRHEEAPRRPREVLSAYFRGFRAPPVHLALANLPVATLEALAVTPGL